MAIKMNANNPDRPRRDERLHMGQIHHVGVVNIGKDRPGSEVNQRFHARKCRVAGHDDLVPGSDALELMQEINDHRPGTPQHALGRARVRRKFLFELLGFLPKNILAGADGSQRGFLHLGIYETF